MAAAQSAQNVHSNEQIVAGPSGTSEASHRSHVPRISSMAGMSRGGRHGGQGTSGRLVRAARRPAVAWRRWLRHRRARRETTARRALGAGTGRPPDLEKRQAIIDATLEVLAEVGYASLTIDAVAKRAGSNRVLIYRVWDSKVLLVRDALFGLAGEPDPARHRLDPGGPAGLRPPARRPHAPARLREGRARAHRRAA